MGLQDHKLHDLPNLKKVEDRKLPERRPSMLRRESTIEDLEIDRVRIVQCIGFISDLLFLHTYFDANPLIVKVMYQAYVCIYYKNCIFMKHKHFEGDFKNNLWWTIKCNQT